MEVWDDGFVLGCVIEEGEKAVGELHIDDSFNELAEAVSAEFMAGDLALKFPFGAICVENSLAEKIVKGRFVGWALLVEWEVGLENVVYNSRVCCEDMAGAEAAVEDEGGGGGGMEYVRHPVYAAMLVCYDGRH